MMLALADVTFEEHVFVLFRLPKDLRSVLFKL